MYEESMIEQKQGIISRRISFDELRTNPNIIKELNAAKAKLRPNLIGNENGRIINVGDFFIETDDVLLLEYGGLKSYTFPIYFTEEDAKLKNLVIAEKLDGSYDSKVLEYDLTAQEKIDLANDNLKTITNPIVTTRLDNSIDCTQISYLVIVACSTGQHNATNVGEWHNCVASQLPRVKVITEVICNGGGGAIPSGTPDVGGSTNQSGGSNNGVPYDYPNSQTNPEEYENGISQPVNPNLNNVNIQSSDPCIKIKAKTSSAEYMAKFNNINTLNNFELNHETGFVEMKINGVTDYIDGIAGGDNTLIIPNGSIGYTHVHNNINDPEDDSVETNIKIQSPKDLEILLTTCTSSATAAGGTNLDAYSIMVSDEGIFALTIINPNINLSEINPGFIKFKERYLLFSKKLINAGYYPSQKKVKLQEMLLGELKILGLYDKVALFEGVVNTTLNRINWTRKTLNSNNTILPTPCP